MAAVVILAVLIIIQKVKITIFVNIFYDTTQYKEYDSILKWFIIIFAPV